MSIGAEQTTNVVAKGDTAELVAYLFDANDNPVAASDISSVGFTVKKPDGSQTSAAGAVQSDGSGFLRWTDTTATGVYVWTAQFVLPSGEKRSYRNDFTVEDLLATPTISRNQDISNQVWLRLEDAFDSREGGPWLREKTKAYFDQTKIAKFIPEGLLIINAWPPTTTVDLSYFTTPIPETDPVILAIDPNAKQADPDSIVIVQATLLATIKHLMRSYVEQPNVQGANVLWQDRRDYMTRWQTIYEIEQDYFKMLVALWKRQFLNYGRSALLVNSKAGRLGYYPGFRARNIGRGWL